MRFKMVAASLVALLPMIAAHAQNAAASPAGAEFVGVWRAEADGLPFVTINITNESGNLSGAVLFYLHRHEKGKPVVSTPGIPEPIFNSKFDGRTLTFQVSHRRAHPTRTLSDPLVSFRLTLTGINTGGLGTGDLANESEGSPGLQLVRSDY